jgi:geranylgeranyl pyrophosphate synthase
MERNSLTTQTFLSPVQDGILRVEERMRSQAEGYYPEISAALNLLLQSGGKRIRPAITLLATRMLGGDEDVSVTLATAIELLHTATLVHDDLIDNSLLRRGSPTLNSQWSPGATVLTGDFVFARAAKMAAETNSVEVMKLFAQTLTIIVNGEITQLFSDRCVVDREGYFRRIYAKTASLFETSAASAAILSGSDAWIIEALGKFGYHVGIAFQIIDDVLDFTGEQGTLGKPVGSDLRQGLITLPTIIYHDTHPDDPRIRRLFEENCKSSNGWFEPLVKTISDSEAISKANQVACDYVQKGIDYLHKLPETPERSSLEELAEYIVARHK